MNNENESEIDDNEINVNINYNSIFKSSTDKEIISGNDANDNESDDDTNNIKIKLKTTNEKRTSNRKKSPVNRFGNPVSHFIYINNINVNVPNTFEEALSSNENKQWKIAMDAEINSLKKNNTCQIVERPKEKKVIDVSKMQTLKILFSYCCKTNLFIAQMDVETAFLNSYVKSEVYINELKGYETGDNKVQIAKSTLWSQRKSKSLV